MERTVVHSLAAAKTIPDEFRGQEAAILATWPRWSQAIRTAHLIFASGVGGTDAQGVPQHVGDVAAQLRIALQRLVGVVESGGGRLTDVFKVRIYLDDAAGCAGAVQAVDELFAGGPAELRPVVALVVANTSDRALHAEIEAWAATSHVSAAGPVARPAGAAGWPSVTRVGNLWFTAGLLARDPSAPAADQLDDVVQQLRQVLEGEGRTLADLVRLTTWVDRAEDAEQVTAGLSALLADAFPAGDLPVLTTLVAPLPFPGARVQLEAVATSAVREVVRRPGAPGSEGIKVRLESEAGSYLRRFTWPAHLTDAELATVGTGTEAPQELGHLVFLAGLRGLTPAGDLAEGMRAQTRAVLTAMGEVVEAAGGTFSDLVQFDVYYADRALYADYNVERIAHLEANVPDKAWFAGSGPRARSTVPGALIEIESIAALP